MKVCIYSECTENHHELYINITYSSVCSQNMEEQNRGEIFVVFKGSTSSELYPSEWKLKLIYNLCFCSSILNCSDLKYLLLGYLNMAKL
jgi:16S rRNA C1402 (ribose-2'-O) methylase RsmI